MRGLLSALVGLVWLSVAAGAGDPVYFADSALKKAVEQTLGISGPTPSDMLKLTKLTSYNNGIKTLTGLEYAEHLQELSLSLNSISDLSPLSGLTELRTLILEDNRVSDLSPLAGLADLQILILEANLITDISPLLNLMSLTHLNLGENSLDEDAYETYIPQIAANNPGIYILHENREHHFVVSAGPGGTILSPGEGDFTYEGRTDIVVEAKADPGFVFIGWSGTYSDPSNPFYISVDEDFEIRANFLCILSRLDVDDDASGDPGPGDPGVSDPRENGTAEHPFDSITEAIGVASAGATIVIYGGTYRETIDCLGKSIELTGFDPNDPNQAAWPMIDGAGKGPVVSFAHGEDPNCRLSGLVITGGQGRSGGAIQCVKSSPTITHCLITGNRATDWNGAVIVCTDSRAAFINCTVAENRGGQFGAALYAAGGGVTVINSILWGNGPREIATEGVAGVEIRYSLVAGGWLGEGNLSGDPMFAGLGRWVSRSDPDTTVRMDDAEAVWAMGDYHVQSQWGRWAPGVKAWLQDAGSSPCIDAGDPTTPVGQEPLPNGGRINLGVYGGTVEASLSADD